jgi:hypothetical protein
MEIRVEIRMEIRMEIGMEIRVETVSALTLISPLQKLCGIIGQIFLPCCVTTTPPFLMH